MDSEGGACENIDSESRASPTSSTSMSKKRRASSLLQTASKRQCLEETDSSDKCCVCFRAFEEDVRQETGSSALAHDGYMKSVFWTV